MYTQPGGQGGDQYGGPTSNLYGSYGGQASAPMYQHTGSPRCACVFVHMCFCTIRKRPHYPARSYVVALACEHSEYLLLMQASALRRRTAACILIITMVGAS